MPSRCIAEPAREFVPRDSIRPHWDSTLRMEQQRFAAVSTVRPFSLESCMNGIIYLIGLIVVIMAILSFLGLR